MKNVARKSNTPGFKAMFVRFVPHPAERLKADATMDAAAERREAAAAG
jgi:formate dehydrogenase major subunit